jgi:hypothetical protein
MQKQITELSFKEQNIYVGIDINISEGETLCFLPLLSFTKQQLFVNEIFISIVLFGKFIWMFSRFHWDDRPISLGCFPPFIQMLF